MFSLLARSTTRSLYRPFCARVYHQHVCLLDELTQRGFIQDVTRPDALRNALDTHPQVVYAGVDPTAQSLHIGHLIPLMCLLHFQIRGHVIIPLIGGATGRVGDPSGRVDERHLSKVGQVQDNVKHITRNIEQFFQHALLYAQTRLNIETTRCRPPRVVSNLEWHENFTMLDFLHTVGVHARVNTMLNRESVRARLNAQKGLSFTEFTYQLLQAYDFYYLNKHFSCTIQVGGSDQWGNILAGLDLIGRIEAAPSDRTKELKDTYTNAYAITTPLLTTSTGQKFGKSAGNAIWLDPSLTSVFDFYQYFLKVTDADVEKYLRLFTLLSAPQIDELMTRHSKNSETRLAQKRLAAEVTEMVHSRESLSRVETLTALLFDSDYTKITTKEIVNAFQNDPRLVHIGREELLQTPLIKLASKYSLVTSTGGARSLINSRGLYLNNVPLCDIQTKISENNLIDNRIAVVRAGRDKHLVLVANQRLS